MKSQNIKTELQYIELIISMYSATEYAEMMIQKEKENFKLTIFNSNDGQFKEVWTSYHNYMRSTWHSDDNAPLEQCIDASRMSKLNYYAEIVRLYTGWVKNGKLFVLNKKEGFGVADLFHASKQAFNRCGKNSRSPRPQCKTPGINRASTRFHVKHASRQRRSGITTWRDFSLLASRTKAEELASRNWMMMCSSRRAESASSR